MNEAKYSWIEQGYMTFAFDGPGALKVERLSNQVGKNKSSFYHYFAELDVFINHLLRYHLEQAKVMAAKEDNCQSLEELIEILIEHRLDLLFNRQLRIHRENPDFQACFSKTNEMTYQSFANLWAQILGLEDNTYLAGLVLRLSLENFFLQITDETLNRAWLKEYFKQIIDMVAGFKRRGERTMDGTV